MGCSTLDTADVVAARVKNRMPNRVLGAELSSMWGWRIMDYTDQYNPVALNRGCKTEAAAWKSLDRRGVIL